VEQFLDAAARMATVSYVAYFVFLWITSFVGLQLILVATLAWRAWGGRWLPTDYRPWGPRDPLPLQIIYGFINPLLYLLVFGQTWGGLYFVAWMLFSAIWGARMLIPRELESSTHIRTSLARLSILGLVCLAAFAVKDVMYVWKPTFWDDAVQDRAADVWALMAVAPLYLIPALMLNTYRVRLAGQDASSTEFLLVHRWTVRRMATGLAAAVVMIIGLSVYHRPESTARARVLRLAPAIDAAAARYQVDPQLLAAIVYVSAQEVGPFRGELERFASGVFTEDAASHLRLGRFSDLSIGAAQIKPVTALTALKLCQSSGQPWSLNPKHLRDTPNLDAAWQTKSQMLAACLPPMDPVPTSKPAVVSALSRDDTNVAFAALILALYQWQWRDANAAWDISARPEILATLYQIGFVRSRPHSAPRSSDFGARVAKACKAPWLRERFGSTRAARVRM
jgi:hypothetical protein